MNLSNFSCIDGPNLKSVTGQNHKTTLGLESKGVSTTVLVCSFRFMQLAGNKIAMLNLTNRTVLAQIQYQRRAIASPLQNQPGTPKLNAENPSTLETASARRGEGRREDHGGTGAGYLWLALRGRGVKIMREWSPWLRRLPFSVPPSSPVV